MCAESPHRAAVGPGCRGEGAVKLLGAFTKVGETAAPAALGNSGAVVGDGQGGGFRVGRDTRLHVRGVGL